MRSRQVLFSFVAVAISFLSGCDPLEIGKAADALDRFSATIDKTTADGQNLDRRIKQLAHELRAVGSDVTQDALIKWGVVRKDTIQDILDLSQKLHLDLRILWQEVHGTGISIPLQIDDSLKQFRVDLRDDLAQLVAPMWVVKADGAPLSYRGLNWTIRTCGYYTVTFGIAGANKLRLKVGGTVIPPEFGGTAGKITFKVPIGKSTKAMFRDTEPMPLGFLLIDSKDKPRHGGLLSLQPRFPIKYEFKVYPADGKKGFARSIECGPAIDDIVSSAFGTDVVLATRHGSIYRLARSRLPFGTSVVEIPVGSQWELKLTFPDGKTELVNPNKPQVNNEMGNVTVRGPNRRGNIWTLQIDVEGKD